VAAHQRPRRRRHPPQGHDPLGQRLVEAQGEAGRVRARVGDLEQLEQGRDLGLAAAPGEALGDVERDVDARAWEHPGELPGGLEQDRLVAELAQGVGDRLDRTRRVELGLALGRGVAGEVVDHAHPQRLAPTLTPPGARVRAQAEAGAGAGEDRLEHGPGPGQPQDLGRLPQ
jgi:hypothetical protein